MKITKISGLLLLMGTVLFVSCKKADEEMNSEIMGDEIVSNQTTVAFELEEMYASLDCEYDVELLTAYSCATITESSPEFPKTITIDYGDGCVDRNGRTKSGKIIIDVTNNMRESGATRTLTFDNFTINEIAVAGNREVENIGINEDGNLAFEIISNLTFTKGDMVRTREVSRVREWIAGSETCTFSDDEYLITGTATTIGPNDREGVHTITSPLHIAPGSCKYILSGEIEVEVGAGRGGTINYGDGTCDNEAVITTKRGREFLFNLDSRTIS